MLYLDKLNPADRPGLTLPQLVDDLVAKGAGLIIANSDDMKDGTREAAKQHPEISFIHVSGDDVLTRRAPPNLGKTGWSQELILRYPGLKKWLLRWQVKAPAALGRDFRPEKEV